GSWTTNDRRPREAETSPTRMRGSASRSAARTDSSIVSSRCCSTWRGLASSRMWLPPARSRPRLTIGRGSAAGHWAPASVTSQGTAASAKSSATPHSQIRFRRGKSSIQPSPVRSVVRRLAAGRNDVAERRLDGLDAHALGDLELDVLLVDLDDLADQPAGGDHLVVLLDRGDLLAVGLLLAHLRTDDEEPEDQDPADDRQAGH